MKSMWHAACLVTILLLADHQVEVREMASAAIAVSTYFFFY
jgi:hypothetical protein